MTTKKQSSKIDIRDVIFKEKGKLSPDLIYLNRGMLIRNDSSSISIGDLCSLVYKLEDRIKEVDKRIFYLLRNAELLPHKEVREANALKSSGVFKRLLNLCFGLDKD